MASLEEQIEATKHTLEALEEEKKKRDTENEKIKNENQRYSNMQNQFQQILTIVREMKVSFLDIKRRLERLEEQNHFKNLNELPPFDFFSKKEPKEFIETISSILNVKQKVAPVEKVDVPYKTVSETSSECNSEASSDSSKISIVKPFDKKESNASPISNPSSMIEKLKVETLSSGSLTPPLTSRNNNSSCGSLTPPLTRKNNSSCDSLTPPLNEDNLKRHNSENPFERENITIEPLPIEFTESVTNNNIVRPISRNSSSSEEVNKNSFFSWNY